MRQAREDWKAGRHAAAVRGFIAREWQVLAFLGLLMILVWQYDNTEDTAHTAEDAAVQAEQAAHDAQLANERLTRGLTKACIRTRRPLQRYFYQRVQAIEIQIAQTQAIPNHVFESFEFPKSTALQRLRDERVNLKRVAVVFDPDNCKAQYDRVRDIPPQYQPDQSSAPESPDDDN